jgi:hypothetical protein
MHALGFVEDCPAACSAPLRAMACREVARRGAEYAEQAARTNSMAVWREGWIRPAGSESFPGCV